MQDWNGCSSLEQDNGSNGDRISITLTDKRDGNTYTVARLKDGKCWMTQNLRIVNKTITSSDSDIQNATFTLPVSNKSNYSDSFRDTINNYLSTSNPQLYGAYYTYPAATAGQGISSFVASGGTANVSICPKGWRLPDLNIAQSLVSQYGYNTIQQPPANFINVGDSPTRNGMYWTASSWGRGYTPYHISINNNKLCVNDGSCSNDNSYGGYGYSVRCLSRE